jgi:hypothetical protein
MSQIIEEKENEEEYATTSIAKGALTSSVHRNKNKGSSQGHSQRTLGG